MTSEWKSFIRDRKIISSTWYSRDWDLYVYSFKKSADLVYAEYIKARKEAYWFPAIYLYRQWMELGLKSAWSDIRRFDKAMPPIPKSHELSKLWNPVKEWLERERVISVDDDFVKSAERIFPIFDQFDPKGTAYRYPPLKLPHPDLINFSLADFDKAIDQIDTVFFALRNLLDEYEEFRVALLRGMPP